MTITNGDVQNQESLTNDVIQPTTDDAASKNQDEIMETANNIVFRPLFAYRKQSAQRRRISSSSSSEKYSNNKRYHQQQSNGYVDKFSTYPYCTCYFYKYSSYDDPYRYTQRTSYPYNYPSYGSPYYYPRYSNNAEYAYVA